jgi:hypothetical protein
MQAHRRNLGLSFVLIGLLLAGCSRGDNSASPASANATPAPAAQPAAPVVLELTEQRLSALPAMGGHSAMKFGPPDISYSWRFGSSEDDLVVWGSFEPAWSDKQFSNVVLTSGYGIQSDLSTELDLAAAIVGIDRAELENKVIPTQEMGGQKVKVFDAGEFVVNGLRVHYKFEDNSGVNGHHKPDLMIAILPEAYRDFAMSRKGT